MGKLYGSTVNIDSPFFRPLLDDEKILRQALRIRFSTAKGSDWTDPDFGFCIDDYLQEGITPAAMDHLKSEMEIEAQKDERVESATVKLTLTRSGTGFEIASEIFVSPKLGGSFSLTLPVSKIDGPSLRKGA